jgi:hypothetical protein
MYDVVLNKDVGQDSWFVSFYHLKEFEKLWYEIWIELRKIFLWKYDFAYVSKLRHYKYYYNVEEYDNDIVHIKHEFLNWEKISWTVRGFEFFPDESK